VDGPDAARGAEQGADSVVQAGVAPGAHDLALAHHAQASLVQGGLQVARRRQSIRGVLAGLLGRDEHAQGLMHDRALRALRRREQAGDHAAAGTSDPGRLAQRPPRVAGELERVDADHRVKAGVAERQKLDRSTSAPIPNATAATCTHRPSSFPATVNRADLRPTVSARLTVNSTLGPGRAMRTADRAANCSS
jgi:hypothetical protein